MVEPGFDETGGAVCVGGIAVPVVPDAGVGVGVALVLGVAAVLLGVDVGVGAVVDARSVSDVVVEPWAPPAAVGSADGGRTRM